MNHSLQTSALGQSTSLDLSSYGDDQIVQVVAKEYPDLILALGKLIDHGLTDDEIVRKACDAGGSAQAMRYVKRCIGPMRRFALTDGNPHK